MIGNSITVVGNMTGDPELRFTKTGKAVASLSIAFNRRWKGSDGTEQEETSFFDVVAWERLGENIAETLSKGDRVVVNGRLQQRSWETNEGDKRYKVEILADEVAPSLKWATATLTRNEKEDGAPKNKRPQATPLDEEPF